MPSDQQEDGSVEQSTDGTKPIQQRGIYLIADTPLSAFPLALEDGSGDKVALAEACSEQLDRDELDMLIQRLIEESNRRANDSDQGEKP